MKNYRIAIFAVLLPLTGIAGAQEKIFSINDLVYEGASRIPVSTYGESRMGFANGTFLIDSARNSLFVIGHSQHMAIAEFAIEGFSRSENLAELPMVRNVQPFSRILDRVPSENVDSINTITGMHKIDGGIWVNAAQFYDGNADNTDTSFFLEDLNNLGTSEIDGYFKLEPKVKSAGWVTEIPTPLQESLGGDLIFGFASNLPINGRNSMGPSAFSVSKENLLNSKSGDVIETNELLSFSIDNQLHPDHYNKSLSNDLWTEVSSAYTGFIVPGTNTYAVFGNSGGHESGIGYKITQDDGRLCGGACPYISSDIYNHYWLWDVEDFVKVKQGLVAPYDVRPYEYGTLELPFEIQAAFTKPRVMIAAYYDYENQDLYFMLGEADSLQNQYESAPILLKYSIETGRRPSAPSGISVE
ncbi:hypothetical protein [Marinobacter manganoxydans]|uniref:Uncharacterized protein n=1 Tax=Marinobacter manganoxydans MnI7-9 TaxID=1094979 RepID=G6YRK7_9GAMM|nr:hypothetical protein [Marinobacter manganoxydans]EHJ05138.1 hypothetical protein KYE_07422 [Marinobacter manganoxydans MnI7-9]